MERLTSQWQPDSNGIAESSLSHGQDENLTDGGTLTDERTDLRTPTKTKRSSLVPNVATPVDKGESFRVVVACINWNHPSPVPHAMSYVLRDGQMVADWYHDTWADAMEFAVPLARRLKAVA